MKGKLCKQIKYNDKKQTNKQNPEMLAGNGKGKAFFGY